MTGETEYTLTHHEELHRVWVSAGHRRTLTAARQAWARIVRPTDGRLLPRPSTLTIPLSYWRADLFVRPIGDRRHPHLTELPDRICNSISFGEGCVRIQGEMIERSLECLSYIGRPGTANFNSEDWFFLMNLKLIFFLDIEGNYCIFFIA